MSDVKVPGLGPVPKKWFVIVGGGSAVVIGYLLYKRKSSAGTAAAGTGAGTAALSGQPCVDANGNPGVYDDSGTCQVDTAALGGYYEGSGAQGVSGVTPPVAGTGGFTTNGQWSQQAEADMASLAGVDPAALAAALGAYITGQPVTPGSAELSLIDQAISFEGYPPVAGPSGYPPGIKLAGAAPGQTGTSTTGTGTGKPATVTGLAASGETKTSVKLHWNASSGATSYQVRVTYQTGAAGGGVIQTHTVTGTSYTVTGLAANRTYGLHVVAIGKGGQAPEASITAKTLP